MVTTLNHSIINSPQAVRDVMSKLLITDDEIDQAKEHFWTLMLDARNAIISIDLVSLGTLNASLVHPREVFRRSIMSGIASIILCHNHPSGDAQPSFEDKTITERLISAGHILGVEVVDHIIIGNDSDNYYSFKEKGNI